MKHSQGQSGSFLPGLQGLHAETIGSPEVLIAVLDGPADLSHPCFAGAEITTISGEESTASASGTAAQHGTHVTSIIFGQHESEVKGIAPRCRGLLVPIFANKEDGTIIPCSEIRLASALLDVLREAERLFPGKDRLPLIINISGGQFSRTGQGHPLLAEAVKKCAAKNALIVAAAGNDGCDCLHVPGSMPSVLVAGAMDSAGVPLPMSNWGAAYRNQGILAIGENILGAMPGGGAVRSSGTSFAAPVVSGAAALLLSLQIKLGQQPDPQAVRKAILDSAVKCDPKNISDCRPYLAGKLDVDGAASIIKQGGKNVAEQAEIQAAQPEDAGVEPAAEEMRQEEVVMSSGEGEAVEPTAAKNEPEGVKMAQGPATTQCKDIGCGKEKWSTNFVYAIGQLKVDFVNQARQDSLQFHAEGDKDGNSLPITLPVNLVRYLRGWKETYMVGENKETDVHKPHMYDAKSIYWILWQDETPIYAIQPMGPFAEEAYNELVDFYAGQTGVPIDIDYTETPQHQQQIEENPESPLVERVAITGAVVGKVQLSTNEIVPVIVPHMRGTAAWSTDSLITHLCSTCFEGMNRETVRQILLRLYEETRNFGITPEDRAVNYVATNVFEILQATKMLPGGADKSINWEFDMISASKSRICRTDSECYDVEFSFYNPDNLMQARRVTTVTVDVSDVVPVIIGKARNFSRR